MTPRARDLRAVTPRIRIASENDAQRIAEIYSPAVTERSTSFEIVPPTAEEMQGRISRILKTHPWLVCEMNDDVVGYSYASPHHERAAYRWSVDVAAYIDTRYHRCGIGRALYTALFDILVLQKLRVACAGITLPNANSEGLHHSFGFTLVGVYHKVGYKFGEWHDVAWFERRIADDMRDPPEPVAFPEIRDDASVHAALRKGQELLRETQLSSR